MAGTTTEQTKTEKGNRRTRRRPTIKTASKDAITEVLEELLQRAVESLKEKEYKVSVAEFLRLTQILREIKGEQAEEVRITWVEPQDESVTAT